MLYMKESIGMKLNRLLEKVDCICVEGDVETEVSSVEYDSRKVRENALFVCLKGYYSDGHDYAQAAVEKGAAALLVEDLPEFATQAVVIQVKDRHKRQNYHFFYDETDSGTGGTPGRTDRNYGSIYRPEKN